MKPNSGAGDREIEDMETRAAAREFFGFSAIDGAKEREIPIRNRER